jgi:HlyD family secretion protein
VADQRRGRIVVVVLGLALAGLAAARVARRSAPLEVQVTRVERGDVREVISSAAAAEVRAARRVTVRAEVAGTVAELPHARGARVTRGAILARFSADELVARVDQARANLDVADVAVRAASTRLDVAAKALARVQTLSQGGAASAADVDRADAEHQAARHAVDQAKATRAQAAAALRLASVGLDRATVRAPFDGVLQDRLVEVGVQVAPGAGLVDLIDDAELAVDVPVDEGDAPRIQVGQSVRLEIDPARKRSISGVVRFIPTAVGRRGGGGGLDPTAALKKDESLYVEVVPESREGLRVGASVNAEILVSSRPEVTYVPTGAVVGRGVERKVWRVQDGAAALVPFKPGLTSWDRTEVLGGLEPGELIITSLNVKGLKDGARVVAAPR